VGARGCDSPGRPDHRLSGVRLLGSGSGALATIVGVNGEGRTDVSGRGGARTNRRVRLGIVRRSDAAGVEQAEQRSDPRRRRDWLRFLDPVLTDEIRDAGALSCDELVELAVRPLKGRASRATIDEWWEYAHRRGWLEEYGTGRRRLTSVARADLHARRQRVAGPDPAEWAKTLVAWTVAGAIGAATYLSGRYGTVWIAILIVCVTVAIALFIASPIVRAFDRPSDRWIARRACDWLDGRRVAWSVPPRPKVSGEFARLYQRDELAASGPVPVRAMPLG
jgi:hypothetical protein